jgi:hypothetical protein
MQRPNHLLAIALVTAIALAGCSSSATAPGAKASADDAGTSLLEGGVEGGAAVDTDVSDDGPAPCSDSPDARPPNSTCILEAKGTVEDLSGAPLDMLVMTFCGSECYGTQSNATGAYSIPIGTFLPTADYAMHADGRPDHAVDYLRLTANEPSVVNVTMKLPLLPPSTVQLPPDGSPASSVTVRDLTLLIPDATTFDLDIEDYGTTAGRTLRVASVPLASAPAYATAANVDAIYALAPSGAFSRPGTGTQAVVKMGVSLKNSAGLPASSPVDFLVLGDDYSSTPPTVGILAVAASGHVSADGTTIQTDPGEGISELTWLAVRKGN